MEGKNKYTATEAAQETKNINQKNPLDLEAMMKNFCKYNQTYQKLLWNNAIV